jgi:RNA polymerase sigma-70 factor (ECF subfamily)
MKPSGLDTAKPTRVNPRKRFEAILDEHEPRLRAFLRARFRGVPGVGVDDVMQELRLRLWQAIERETNIEHPASYLMQTAVRVMIDAQRRAAVRRPEGGFVEWAGDQSQVLAEAHDAQPETPEQEAQRHQARARLQAALERLAPDRARMVRLYLQGFGAGEIADLTGWTEPRCRNLLYRGLADLKNELAIEA